MKAEQINLETAKHGDKFTQHDGRIVTFSNGNGLGNYPYMFDAEGDHPTSFTAEGKFHYLVDSKYDLFHSNETSTEDEPLEDTTNILISLIEHVEDRLSSAENRIDVLMGERSEAIEESYNRLMDAVAEASKQDTEHETDSDTITASALLELGFEECYQEAMSGEPGFIYYAYNKHGFELLSNSTGDEDALHIFTEGNHPIDSLRKLADLITSLNKL